MLQYPYQYISFRITGVFSEGTGVQEEGMLVGVWVGLPKMHRVSRRVGTVGRVCVWGGGGGGGQITQEDGNLL